MKVLAEYVNGNTHVQILSDGTKIREHEGDPFIDHPESIDVKITDYCDVGCSYCHESSTKKGSHADLEKLLDVLNCLPAGVELAIGGGNPLSHPDILGFLREIKERGLIANLTVNQGHLKTFHDLLVLLIREDLVKGIGISITSNNFTHVKPLLKLTDNIVYHVIAGINDIDIIDRLSEIGYCKVLVLGYKKFGFGTDYHDQKVDDGILKWKKNLHRYIGENTMSFDNLAIEQLNVKRLFTHDGWNKFYMGDDFCFTMYIDAVKQEFAPTSRSHKRESFSSTNLLNYFKNDEVVV